MHKVSSSTALYQNRQIFFRTEDSYDAGKTWVQEQMGRRSNAGLSEMQLWGGWIAEHHPCLNHYLNACTEPHALKQRDDLFIYNEDLEQKLDQLDDVICSGVEEPQSDLIVEEADKFDIFPAARFMLEFLPEHELTKDFFYRAVTTHVFGSSSYYVGEVGLSVFIDLLKYFEEKSVSPQLDIRLNNHFTMPDVMGGFRELKTLTIQGYHEGSHLEDLLQSAWPKLEMVSLQGTHVSSEEKQYLFSVRPNIQWNFLPEA